MLPPRSRIERGASDLRFLTCRPSSAFHLPLVSALCLYGHVRRYVLSEKDKQPTFTGREQRVGVWILPFLVAGIFGPGRRKPPKEAGGVPARSTAATAGNGCTGADGGASEPGEEPGDEADATARSFLNNFLGVDDDDEEEACPADTDGANVSRGDADDQEDIEAVQSSARFDWPAYRRAFPDTPLHAAVTAMFAEYALLVGRITRHLGAAVGSPMTLGEGEEIAQQARTFVLCYVTPILGPLRTTKVHKLLCHVLDAVRLHGSIANGDTSMNEQQHKLDKRHYGRTNKGTRTYMRQLVRHAQGSRAVLTRNKALQEAPATLATAPSDSDGYEADEDDAANNNTGTVRDGTLASPAERQHPSPTCAVGRAVASADGAGSAAVPVGEERAVAAPRLGDAHLPLLSIHGLAAQPGLSSLGALLGKEDAAKVRVPSSVHFVGRTASGVPHRFLVRAAPRYRGSPWYDHLVYRCSGAQPESAERVGKVLLLLRLQDGDAAVVATLQRADGDDGPLSSRGCTPLQWVLEGAAGVDGCSSRVQLALVPLSHCLRVVHVVPDFVDLLRRRGVGATPGDLDDSAALVHQRFLLNAFSPSSGVRVLHKE